MIQKLLPLLLPDTAAVFLREVVLTDSLRALVSQLVVVEGVPVDQPLIVSDPAEASLGNLVMEERVTLPFSQSSSEKNLK